MKNANEKMGKRLGYLRDIKFGKMHGSKTLCAQELGISTGYWGDIERGRKKIGIDLIQKLASFFDTDCEWLITGKSHNVFFLAQYYTEKYREDTAWYKNLVIFIELAVKWRSKKNNKFFQAAAMTLKCKQDAALWGEVEDLFNDSASIDSLIDLLSDKDEGKSARNKLGRVIKGIIQSVEEDLIDVESESAKDLPSVISASGADMDSDSIIKLLEEKVMELEENIAGLKKELRSEKAKVTRLKKKLA